jgi:thermitase
MTRPFGDDYREVRAADQLAADQPKVAQQVDGLRRLAGDPEYIEQFVGRLERRREGSGAVRIEAVRRPDGQIAYVAAGQALVDRSAVEDDEGARAQGMGLRLVDHDPDGEVLLVVPADPTDERSAREIVTQLRGERGYLRAAVTSTSPVADYNYIVPLGGIVMKAEGGPENTDGRRPFPAVTYPSVGERVTVAIIDTGISLEKRSDGYLQDLVQPDNVDALDALPFPVTDGLLDAEAGHGSFVAGIVQQVAPTARITVLKVTGPDGLCTDLQVATAIRRAAADGADIINLSLGTSTADDNPPPAMLAAIRDVLETRDHLLIVVAAGNDGDNGVPMWPAALSATGPGKFRFDRVVAVAGLDPDEQPSEFSSRGEYVTVSTVGRGVLSTYVIGTENGELINDPTPDTFGPDAWAVWTGTSFAAPQISGAVARRCEEFDETPPVALAKLLGGIPRTPQWGQKLTILPGT